MRIPSPLAGLFLSLGVMSSCAPSRENPHEAAVRALEAAAGRGERESQLLERLRGSELLRRPLSASEFVEMAKSSVPATVIATIIRCTDASRLTTASVASLVDATIPKQALFSMLSVADLSQVDWRALVLPKLDSASTEPVLTFLSSYGTIGIPNTSVPRTSPPNPPLLKLRSGGGEFARGKPLQLEAVLLANSSRWLVTTTVPLNYRVISVGFAPRLNSSGALGASTPLAKRNGTIRLLNPPQSRTSQSLIALGTTDIPEVAVPLLTSSNDDGDPIIVDYESGGYCLPDGRLVPYGATHFYTIDKPGRYSVKIAYRYTGIYKPDVFVGRVFSNVWEFDLP